MIVGEALGEEEEKEGVPFIGETGKILTRTLSDKQIKRDQCIITNVVNVRPPSNRFEWFFEDGKNYLSQGVIDLRALIAEHKPKCILALGNHALQYLTGKYVISRFRGYALPYLNDKSIIVVPTYHPSFISRGSGKEYPIFDLDVAKAVYIALNGYKTPSRSYYVSPTEFELDSWTNNILQSDLISVDIESYKKHADNPIICVGFSPTNDEAYVIPTEIPTAWHYIRKILESPVGKVFHYGHFDTEMLRFYSNIETKNWVGDTYVALGVLYPEFPRSLEFIQSIYSDEPYYKKEGRGEIPEDTKVWSSNHNKNDLYIYNSKDCVVTREAYTMMEVELEMTKMYEYYKYKMRCARLARDIGSHGLLVDNERKELFYNSLLHEWKLNQLLINSYFQTSVNVNSPKLPFFLYDKMGLPVRLKDKKRTADDDARASSISYLKGMIDKSVKQETKAKYEAQLEVVRHISKVKKIRKLISSYVNVKLTDERIKSSFGVITDTSRWNCSKYINGTGLNTQTFPREPISLMKIKVEITPEQRDQIEKDKLEVDSSSSEGEASNSL